MAEVYKVLGQRNPAATTLEALYTVPASTEAIVSTIVVCNRTSSTRSLRLAVAPGGAADSLEQYFWYDKTLLKNDTLLATVGLTLAAGDVVRVYADAIGLSFALYGTEIS